MTQSAIRRSPALGPSVDRNCGLFGMESPPRDHYMPMDENQRARNYGTLHFRHCCRIDACLRLGPRGNMGGAKKWARCIFGAMTVRSEFGITSNPLWG